VHGRNDLRADQQDGSDQKENESLDFLQRVFCDDEEKHRQQESDDSERGVYVFHSSIPPRFVGENSTTSTNDRGSAMRAAIYARKSTDDSDRISQDKSVERQVAHARDFIAKKGWSAKDEHVYVDDNISGAEFKHRPGLLKLLDHLKEFDAIVMSEQSRIGREMSQTSAVLAKITARKVRIFFYLGDQELKFHSAVDKFMVAAVAFGNELERELASLRCRDAALKRAKEGRNFGGRVFGYDNVWLLPDGRMTPAERGIRKAKDAQTLYRINDAQADVVRSIFRMHADGYGLAALAKTLNGDPRYRQQSVKYFAGSVPHSPFSRTGSWAPSSLYSILRNARYLGKIPFGRSRKYIDIEEGTKKRNWNTGEEQLFDAPDLRIVDDVLWRAAHTARSAASSFGSPRAPGDIRESRYLLSGLCRCGICSARVTIVGGRGGHRYASRPIYYYGCGYYQKRGKTICDNDHRVRMQILDERVLQAIESQVLRPEYLKYAIDRALEIVLQRRNSGGGEDRRREIKKELKRLHRELHNLISLAAGGRGSSTLLREITAREARIGGLERELADIISIESKPRPSDVARIREALEAGAGRFKDLMRSDIPGARNALRQLFAEPLVVYPVMVGERKGLRFEGKTRIGSLVDPGLYISGSPGGVRTLHKLVILPIVGIAA
jgi:DNA invertase Pin-like site-specific DNA recombinase